MKIGVIGLGVIGQRMPLAERNCMRWQGSRGAIKLRDWFGLFQEGGDAAWTADGDAAQMRAEGQAAQLHHRGEGVGQHVQIGCLQVVIVVVPFAVLVRGIMSAAGPGA